MSVVSFDNDPGNFELLYSAQEAITHTIPLQIVTRLSMMKYETLEYKDYRIEEKKNFHRPVSELPAKLHRPISPLGQIGRCRLAGNSETGR